MYHSVTIGSMNTFSDWHLVPDSRPVIVLPETKTVTVDIPGSNGILDLSESLTHYPLYNNRSGTLEFHVLNDYTPWDVLYHRIANYLHGRRRNLVLEDDPMYYYTGRYAIEWTSNNDGTWSDVAINYELDPYKQYVRTSIQEDSRLYENITVSNSTINKDLTGDRTLGEIPVVPEFVATIPSGGGITLTLSNQELGIVELSKTISSSGTWKFHDMIFSNMHGTNPLFLKIAGRGTVSIVFRRMAL